MRQILLFITLALGLGSCATRSNLLNNNSLDKNAVSSINWNKAFVDDVAVSNVVVESSQRLQRVSRIGVEEMIKHKDSATIADESKFHTYAQKQFISTTNNPEVVFVTRNNKNSTKKPVPERIVDKDKDHRRETFSFFLFVFGLIFSIGVFTIGTVPIKQCLRILALILTLWSLQASLYDPKTIPTLPLIMQIFGIFGWIMWLVLLIGV